MLALQHHAVGLLAFERGQSADPFRPNQYVAKPEFPKDSQDATTTKSVASFDVQMEIVTPDEEQSDAVLPMLLIASRRL